MSLYTDEIAPDAVSPSLIEDKNEVEQSFVPMDTVIALYDFPGTQPSHLPLNLGDTVYVLSKSESGWWDGVLVSNQETLRGWFPHNYVQSVNHVQPILNNLRNNKEIDTITAANTAANVLIPSFTSLLQKNLLDSEKNSPTNSTRKNSVVSFASSENSNPSDSKADLSNNNNTTATTATTTTTTIGGGGGGGNSNGRTSSSDLNNEIRFVSLKTAEKASEEYFATHQRYVTWLLRTTTSGGVVFYSESLNLYCQQLPLTTYRGSLGETPKIEYSTEKTISDASYLNSFSDYTLVNDAPVEPLEQTRSVSDTSKDFDPIKRDSNASSVSSQNTLSSYHHFSQPFFATEGVFYSSPNDIRLWTDLRNDFFRLLDLSYKDLKDINKNLFSIHFNAFNRLVAAVSSALRLILGDYMKTKYEEKVKRKHKRLMNSFSQIYINSILHLGSMHQSADLPESRLLSTDTAKTLKSGSSQGNTSGSTSSSISTLRKNGENSLSIPSPKNSVSDNNSKRVTYFQQIEFEMENLKKNFNSLIELLLKLSEDKIIKRSDYDSSDVSDDEGESRYNQLPQVHARLFRDEFNGGNWCNPFFSNQNTVLNPGGNDLKTKYHQKVIIDRDAYEIVKTHTSAMGKLSAEILKHLDPKSCMPNRNDSIKDERNTQILRLVYKFLYHASNTIDVIESFDFTVFCLIHRTGSDEDLNDGKDSSIEARIDEQTLNQGKSSLTFDYPLVLDFLQFKQYFHDLLSKIVMSTQSLTLEDPEVFKSIKEDDVFMNNPEKTDDQTERAVKQLNSILIAQSNLDKGGAITANTDTLLYNYLNESIKFSDLLLEMIKQLIDERETIFNYATRVMRDDFNIQLLLTERHNTLQTEKSEEGHSYFSSKNKYKDVPWYLEGDEEYDLLLDIKGNIKGGSKEALVAHLTHHDYFDSNFNTAFLLTFATMMSLGELITLLVNRFNLEAPEGLSYEEFNDWNSKKQTPIRLRVLNVMKLLVQKHWTNSYYNETVIRRWLMFVKSPVAQAFTVSKVLVADLQNLLSNKRVLSESHPSVVAGRPPAPLYKPTMRKPKLSDIDYIELARQITLREFKIYSKITKYECLAKVWGKKSGLKEDVENIREFIRASNQLTNFVAYMILRKQDVRKRVQIIRYFVQVAEKCRQLNNFSSMTAIISALYSSSIHRLKKTWALVSPATSTNLQNMNRLMNSSRNFNEYRDVLTFIGSEPCVPFFGVYLSDLTFIYHGNPDHLVNRSRILNFAKRAKTSEILRGIDRFKSCTYNLLEVPEIQKFLDSWLDKCPSIEEQYQLSLNLEPREPPASQPANSGLSNSTSLANKN